MTDNLDSNPNYQHLLSVGCSPLEAELYLRLLSRPLERASSLAKSTNAGRTNVYYALDQLESMGLVAKIDKPGQVARYTATKPKQAFGNLKSATKQASDAKIDALDSLIGSLQSQYNYLRGEPNVRFFEGLSGLEQLYTDILREGEDILLFRSHLDNDIPGLRKLVANQIQEQVRKRIHTRALVPTYAGGHRRDIVTEDKERLVERRSLPRDKFLLPAQIIVYSNKVGITTFDDLSGTTIIENPVIATTLRVLFDLLWEFGD